MPKPRPKSTIAVALGGGVVFGFLIWASMALMGGVSLPALPALLVAGAVVGLIARTGC